MPKDENKRYWLCCYLPPEFFYARDEYKEKALELIDDNENPQVIDEIFLEIIDDKKKN